MSALPSLSRRSFVAGGALTVAFAMAAPAVLAQAKKGKAKGAKKRPPGDLGRAPALDSWIRIEADGRVTVFTGKAELGQGIRTAIAQIAADELDMPLARVTVVTADTGRTPNEGFTAGSQSIEGSGIAVRYAAAEARHALVELAAKKFGADAATLAVADGAVRAADGRSVSFGELFGGRKFDRKVTGAIQPKPPAQHKLVGKPVKRLDIPGKVFGQPSYVQDLRLPGMVHGRTVQPPHYGARLVGVNIAAVNAMPGVIKVVRDGSFLGVIAEHEWQAIKAMEKLASVAKWKGKSGLPPFDRVSQHLRSMKAQNNVIAEAHAAPDARPARTLSARFTRPFQSHGSIGPSCAVAHLDGGKLNVWSHCQGVFPLRGNLARVVGMKEGDIRVVHTEGSGCYGHNAADDAACDAALLARALPGRPVRVQWMRQQEFGWEPFGSAMVMEAKAGLDGSGRIVDWQYEVWSLPHSTRPEPKEGNNLMAGWHLARPLPPAEPHNIPQPSGDVDRNAVPLYRFANHRVVEHFIPEMPVRVSALRTLGGYANVFALESFMDELAHAAGADPVEFRLRHLDDPRAKAVIEATAKAAGWKPGAKGGQGRGRGFAFARYKNHAAYFAVIADVEVDRASGRVRVHKLTGTVDSGQTINPDGLKNQMEGGAIQATSWTLMEQVTFDAGGITSRDWNGYPILRFDEVPEVEIAVIDRPDAPPLGSGEAAQGPAGAAVANAVFDAIGARLRDIPLTPERVKAAIG